MATSRSKADLLALFPDNTVQEIGPGDLRDLVESSLTGAGALSITTVPGTYTVPGGDQVVLGWDNGYSDAVFSADQVQGRISVSIECVIAVQASLSFDGGGNGDGALTLRKNGVNTVFRGYTRVQNNVAGELSLSGILAMSPGDYVELFKTGSPSLDPLLAQTFTAYRIG